MTRALHEAHTVRIPQPRAAVTGRIELAYAQRIARSPSVAALAAVVLLAAVAGLAMVAAATGVWR